MDPLMTQKIGEAIHDDYVRQAARDRLGRQAQSGDRTPRAGVVARVRLLGTILLARTGLLSRG